MRNDENDDAGLSVCHALVVASDRISPTFKESYNLMARFRGSRSAKNEVYKATKTKRKTRERPVLSRSRISRAKISKRAFEHAPDATETHVPRTNFARSTLPVVERENARQIHRREREREVTNANSGEASSREKLIAARARALNNNTKRRRIYY